MCRHQHSRQDRRHGHCAESRHLRDRHVATARIARHNFRHIRIHHHDFRPNPHSREKTRHNQPNRIRRKSSRQSKRRINQQQRDERNSPSHAVATHAEENGSEKHSQEPGSHKPAELSQRKKSRMLQSSPDVRHDENVVEIEKIAERNQCDKLPVKCPQRQPFNPSGNRRTNRARAHRYFTRSTTPIFSNANKYSSTICSGTGPYSAETRSRISCAYRPPFARFSTSYAYSSPAPHKPW
jgi:hypothetical protein